jgi:hypothetical protein
MKKQDERMLFNKVHASGITDGKYGSMSGSSSDEWLQL